MTGLVDEKKAAHILYLDFRKAFDAVFHNILIDKLLMYELNDQAVGGLETGWTGPEGVDQQHKVYLEASKCWGHYCVQS